MEIKLLTDVEDVVRGTKQVGDKLEAVADELEALGRSGTDSGDLMARGMAEAHKAADKAGEGIGDAFKDGSKSAGKSVEGIQDDLKKTAKSADVLGDKGSQVFRELGRDAKAAGDKSGKALKDGFKDAGDGVSEFGDEANSTAKETAASFDGSAESIVGSFQEIAANAFAGFGPAGAAAGLAAALGIGMAVTAMQAGAENATELKQKAVDMLDQLEQAGGDLSKIDYAETIKGWGREVMEDNWVSFWADESTTKIQETAKDAKAAGLDAVEAVKAAAGSADDSRAFLDKTGDAWQTLTERIQEGTSMTLDGVPVMDESARAAKTQRDALSDLRGQAEENIKTTEAAVDIYGIETAAVDDGTAELEAKNEALEAQAKALDEAANAALAGLDAEIAYNDSMAQGIKDIKANGKGLDLHTAAGKANQQTLADMAGASNKLRDSQIEQGISTDAVKAKTAEARKNFIDAATAAGMGSVEAGKLADKYGLVPKNVDTHVKAHNVAKTKEEIKGLGAPVSTPIKPYLDPGAKWSFDQELRSLTAPRVQSVSMQILKNNGMPLP